MDLSKSGNCYALVFQDYLTKWPELYAVADRKATTVVRCLADIIWRHGVPSQIIHDHAAEFLSDVLQETAQVLGVKQLPTSGGYLQTDGQGCPHGGATGAFCPGPQPERGPRRPP